MNKNIILSIVFGVLLAVFFVTQFMGSDNDRNFREILVEVDTAEVTKIVLGPKDQSITLEKTDGSWRVTNDTLRDQANTGSVESMLSSLVKMVPQRLVAKSEERWADYEVDDSLGTRVRVFAADDLLADLVIGRVNLERTSRAMSTFVRLHGEEETYAVEGFLSSSFTPELNNLRDKTFLKAEKANLTSLKFDYPGDSSFVLKKINDQWQINHVPADSATVGEYLDGLDRLAPGDFAGNFTPADTLITYQLTISGNNMAPVTVRGFQKEQGELILHSSLNENAYFQKGSMDVFERLFTGKNSLLGGPTEEPET